MQAWMLKFPRVETISALASGSFLGLLAHCCAIPKSWYVFFREPSMKLRQRLKLVSSTTIDVNEETDGECA